MCNGSGIDPQHKQAHDAWRRSKPPTGEGFQLWQNTSEDSPISPVFDSLRKLADWCQDNATTFGSNRATAQQWYDMLEEDNVHHQEGNMVFL